ncbi:hypothetical protein ACLKA7_012276 [Drosophila subpalustris]
MYIENLYRVYQFRYKLWSGGGVRWSASGTGDQAPNSISATTDGAEGGQGGALQQDRLENHDAAVKVGIWNAMNVISMQVVVGKIFLRCDSGYRRVVTATWISIHHIHTDRREATQRNATTTTKTATATATTTTATRATTIACQSKTSN